MIFSKMHGLGNDFVVISELEKSTPFKGEIKSVQTLCDRRLGVGCDQILWLKKPDSAQAHFRMDIFNPDGSVAEMCGNGIRAAALYVLQNGPKTLSHLKEFKIETLAGLLKVWVMEHTGVTAQVRVEMGIPKFSEKMELLSIPNVLESEFLDVNMGNPHAVFFKKVSEIELATFGPQIETHTRFPKKTNVEFVEIVSPNHIRVKVWERGAGVTLACGTGACASAVAAFYMSKISFPVAKVELPGGLLEIEWKGAGHPIYMTGPAQEVFRGEYFLL